MARVLLYRGEGGPLVMDMDLRAYAAMGDEDTGADLWPVIVENPERAGAAERIAMFGEDESDNRRQRASARRGK